MGALFGCRLLSGASLHSVAQDPTGLVLPNAQVSLNRQSPVASSRNSLTDNAGKFAFAELAPGTYALRIALPGFAVWRQTDVRVEERADVELPAIVLQFYYTVCSDIAPEHRGMLSRIKRWFGAKRPAQITVCE